MSKATGASALFGVLVDAPSDIYSVGRPGIDQAVIAAPSTTPSASAGTSGNLTGSFIYRASFGQRDGAMTNPGPADTTVSSVAAGTPFLNDITSGGTGSVGDVFHVEIDAAGTPDTFRYRKGSAAWTSGVSITGASQTLTPDAATVTFGATTGHQAPGFAIGTAAPVGTPALDDLTSGGTYSGSAAAVYDVAVDGSASPDTYKWRKDGGSYTTGVNMITGAATLSDGVTVSFGATFGHTIGDAWTITVAAVAADAWTLTVEGVPLTVAGKRVSITAIPVSADAKCDRRIIERSDDGGLTWAICGYLYDNTTTVFTDNVAVLDGSKTLPTLNQSGANYGFVFLEPDSFDIDPEFSSLPVMALLGTAGKPRSIPGPIKIDGAPKSDMRPAELLPFLLSGGGMPDSYAQVAGEPTFIGVWHATTGKRNARTISAFTYDGSPQVDPNFIYQLACEELDFTFAGGKIEAITPKFTGANYGISAPSTKIAGTGTWGGYFAAIGQRYDAKSHTDDVYVKITQALASNVVKFKVKVGSGASYSGAEYTLYTNATSHNQTKGGLQFNDAIEIADEAGLFLGADVGSNRQPFMLVTTAPLTTDLHLNDEFQIPRTAAIPGVGSAPYSGVPARFATGPRFTDAHVTIIQDGNVIEATGGTLKFGWPKKDVHSLGAGARTIQDLPNEGFFTVQLTITDYLSSNANRNQIRTDARGVVRVALEGERIPINPGVLSTYREALYVDLPQVAVTSVKAPVAGQTLVQETVTLEAEQPDDSSKDLYVISLISRQGWKIPA